MSVGQLRFPWDLIPRRSTTRGNRRTVVVGGRTWPLVLTRHRRARRYVLRMTSDLSLRLTVPRGASIEAGLRFVQSQETWIGREWARRAAREQSWAHGRLVWCCGELLPLDVTDESVALGEFRWPRSNGDDVRTLVETGLRAHAASHLTERCRALAEQTGESVARISIRNQRSRWGSCSSRRTIALNWRLLQMPPDVCDYVILHELMHLRQPNHSRAFWREVASVCPAWREAEAWLRRHGKELL
jgi:predicted metal-dependent hydrolase